MKYPDLFHVFVRIIVRLMYHYPHTHTDLFVVFLFADVLVARGIATRKCSCSCGVPATPAAHHLQPAVADYSHQEQTKSVAELQAVRDS